MKTGGVMKQNAAHGPGPADRPEAAYCYANRYGAHAVCDHTGPGACYCAGRVFSAAGFAARRAGKTYPDGLSFVVKPVMAVLAAQACRCSIVTQGVEQ